jgi:hypothetical protein
LNFGSNKPAFIVFVLACPLPTLEILGKMEQIYNYTIVNQDKKVASFCCLVAEYVPAMFCNIYLVKFNKIANISTNSKYNEKNKNRFGTLGFLDFICVNLTRLRSNQIFSIKLASLFSHWQSSRYPYQTQIIEIMGQMVSILEKILFSCLFRMRWFSRTSKSK